MRHKSTFDRSRTGMQLITFRLGAEYYGIHVPKVREILRPVDLFSVPGMGERVEGVINLRGEIIPIVKIGPLLGLALDGQKDAGRKRRMIIIDDAAGKFGFFVDEVLEVARIQPNDLQGAPALGAAGPSEGVVTGIVKIAGRMIVCIDPEKIVRDDILAKELVIDGS